jgi:ADP-dependent NAD(P)H-hydrate dehydratase
MSQSSPLPKLKPRRPDSHKGDFGRALLVGGSRGMSGAIALSGMSALRGGTGLVTIAAPSAIVDTVAGFEPSYMTVPLPDADGRLTVAAKDQISELADQATCIGCGPGLGRSQQVTDLIAWMYVILPKPLIVDADGLAALAQHQECLAEPGGMRIWTPHPGEFRRFVTEQGLSREAYEHKAVELAAAHHAVIVLKGNRTFITDGTRSFHNMTGNPAMATGGTGDVLTGLITAMVCQGLEPLEAARLAVHVHGLAGDLAAKEIGPVGMIASDLLRFIPRALQQANS